MSEPRPSESRPNESRPSESRPGEPTSEPQLSEAELSGAGRTRVAVLGSTGSIGVSTLDVLARHPQRFAVQALSARRNIQRLLEQCLQHRPALAAVETSADAAWLAEQLQHHGAATQVLSGDAGLCSIAAHRDVDAVMAAIVGAAGLPCTLAAARAGKRIMLANKEALVMSGPLFMQTVREGHATLLPVDSEHNAIFQCSAGEHPTGVRRILLTASGGPFLRTPRSQLAAVTPEQACAHPRWVMGRKISVDSATLMNKGLELIEACLLFAVPPAQVDVVVHPQSIVHSLVEYCDGSMLAQLGNPDMRVPIAHALGWPRRIGSGVESLDIVKVGRLDFEAPDLQQFPCLSLARQAAEVGGTAPTILNAANEVAVEAFLQRRLGFLEIPLVIEEVLSKFPAGRLTCLQDVLAADAGARQVAQVAVASAAGVGA